MTTSLLRGDVLDALGRAIVSGELAPGRTLRLEDIQARHGVSRTLARDCVRHLESLGLVESRRRVGAIVLPRAQWSALAPQLIAWQIDVDPDGPTLGGLTELRAAIEPVAAAAAARRATEEQRSALLTLGRRIQEQGRRGGVSTYLQADIEFHSLILAASQNAAFSALTGVVAEVLRGRARLGGEVDIPKQEALELHREVADAIASGSSARAEEATRQLVSEVRSMLLEHGLRGWAAGQEE